MHEDDLLTGTGRNSGFIFIFRNPLLISLRRGHTQRENTDLNQSDNIAFIDLFGKRSTRARSEMNQLCRKQNYYHFVVYC